MCRAFASPIRKPASVAKSSEARSNPGSARFLAPPARPKPQLAPAWSPLKEPAPPTTISVASRWLLNGQAHWLKPHIEQEKISMDSTVNKLNGQAANMLDKIDLARQARRNKFYLHDEHITLSHGSGGKATHNLIEGIFAPAFSNPLLDRLDDAAVFMAGNTQMAFTTDSYVVNPLFFPGGNIGTLAVHGTINDLAM